MRKIEIKIGDKFNKLTFQKEISRNRFNNRQGVFICDCGKTTIAVISKVNSGERKSCGCIHRMGAKIIHGDTVNKMSIEYSVWARMKDRCLRIKSKSYKNYGGRGIKVCDRWINSFENFLADMGRKPTLKHSIERIDNNGNYEPFNCKWAVSYDQQRNTRQNLMITHENKTMCLADWSKEIGINRSTIKKRINSGWSMIDTLTKKVKIYDRS